MIADRLSRLLDVVEPAARVAQRFGVRYADDVLAVAATVRESLADVREIEAALVAPEVAA